MPKKKPPPPSRANVVVAIARNIAYGVFGMYLLYAQSTRDEPSVVIIAVGLLLCGFPVAEISEALRILAIDRWSQDQEETDK